MNDLNLAQTKWLLERVRASRKGTGSNLEALAGVALDVTELLLAITVNEMEQKNAKDT